ncbi:HNH endonuclease [Candidatus Pacearchaeota archaeon]|nr:HNH endonuclease [Candidatus Pacearchaeota archaeon]
MAKKRKKTYPKKPKTNSRKSIHARSRYPRKKKKKYYNSSRNYNDEVYKEWRKSVFKRDGHCCQWHGCKKTKGLNAHHILTWAAHPGLRYDVMNGITLCKYHHDQIHNKEDIFAPMFMKLLAEKGKSRYKDHYKKHHDDQDEN